MYVVKPLSEDSCEETDFIFLAHSLGASFTGSDGDLVGTPISSTESIRENCAT